MKERESDFIAQTALGNRLVSLRTKAIAAGMRLLTEDEVLEEVKRRRGELEDKEHSDGRVGKCILDR